MGRPRNIGPVIVNLRDKGYTYSQIIAELGCTKSTISYHVGANEKKLSKVRLKKYRENAFYRRSMQWDFKTKESQLLLEKCNNKREDVIKYIRQKQNNRDPYTNRPLLSDAEVHLDHRIPKGAPHYGSNEITNCDILNPETNQAKSNKTHKEFVQLCKDVVDNYKI